MRDERCVVSVEKWGVSEVLETVGEKIINQQNIRVKEKLVLLEPK